MNCYPGEFRISLVTCRPDWLTSQDKQDFAEVVVLGNSLPQGLTAPLEAIGLGRRLRQTLDRMRPDFLLTVGSLANILGSIVWNRTPVLLSVHADPAVAGRQGMKHILSDRILHHCYRSRTLVTPSSWLAHKLADHYDARKIRIIPHGVDAKAVAQRAADAMPSLPGAPYAIACGRLTAAKDYATLIRAWDLARRQGVQHHLLILGEGELRAEIEAQIQSLHLEEVVHLPGHQANPFPYLQHAQFYVLSSVSEGFGLSIIEAMALGLPCLVTDSSAPTEIVGEGKYGLLAPPGDPSAMADAIVRLAGEEKLRQQLAAASRVRAEYYSLAKMAEEYRLLILGMRQSFTA